MKNLATIIFLALFSQFAFSVHVFDDSEVYLELGETKIYFNESTETYTIITAVGNNRYLVKEGVSLEEVSSKAENTSADVYFNPQTELYEIADSSLEPIRSKEIQKTSTEETNLDTLMNSIYIRIRKGQISAVEMHAHFPPKGTMK